MARSAFTLIELMMVIAIIVLLAGLTLPTVTASMRRSSGENAARTILEANRVASDLARRHQPAQGPTRPFFGVVIAANPDGSSPRVMVTWGTSYPPTVADVLVRKSVSWTDWVTYNAAPDAPGSPPVWSRALPASVQVHRPLSDPRAELPVASVGWLHQYQTGYPIISTSSTAPAYAIGVKPDPLLVLRNGRHIYAIAFYEFGIGKVANVQ